MNRTRFVSHTESTAPDAAKPILRASERQFGFLPSPVARAAESPTLLKHMMASFSAFEHSSLDISEREVVAMTVAFETGCHYCMAMHSTLLSREHPELVASLRAGATLQNTRLQALSDFVRAAIAHHAHIPEPTWRAFLQAGFTAQQALDAVLGTSVYLLSTYTNILTEAPLDPAFEAYHWVKPQHAAPVRES
jgi:AhpD family alkylhydroperoxidase